MIFHYSIIITSKGMKKRALCPLSGVHLTIKPDFYLHRGTFFFQFVDFQCVVGEGFTFRCFYSIALWVKALGVKERFAISVHRNIAVRNSYEERVAANFRSEMRVKERWRKKGVKPSPVIWWYIVSWAWLVKGWRKKSKITGRAPARDLAVGT